MSRTRISQKTINSKGAITGTKTHGDPRRKAGMILCCPRKTDRHQKITQGSSSPLQRFVGCTQLNT
jgi:hypothetical protein